MQQQVINVEAMTRAMHLIVGPQVTDIVAKTYEAFNSAMRFARLDGFVEAQEQAELNVEERLDAAFDNGFMGGQAQAEDEFADKINVRSAEAYDEGYVEGVADARARPDVADDNVQDIINIAAASALNGEYDADLVRDSGDEDGFSF